MNHPATTLSPLTGGKILSRDLSLLRGLSVSNRRNYIQLSASSDPRGRFFRRSLDLGVDDVGVRRLAKKNLVACYKDGNEDVGYIPGGESHSRFAYSPISTTPPPLERMPSARYLFLHREHRLLYRELSNLDTVVLHALINLSDSHGRGRLCHQLLFGIIGPCKREDDSRLSIRHLEESTARLAALGRLKVYSVSGSLYYAALDAKQWGMHYIPASKIPPPPGEGWNYSLDSDEGLAWHRQRKETRKTRAEKRKTATPSNGSPRTGAAKRARSGEASKEDLDYLFSTTPHKIYKSDRSNAAVFAANVFAGKVEYPLGELRTILEIVNKKNLAIELDWFAAVTGKQVEDALRETNDQLHAAMGAEPI
jgi:hypothetical protein